MAYFQQNARTIFKAKNSLFRDFDDAAVYVFSPKQIFAGLAVVDFCCDAYGAARSHLSCPASRSLRHGLCRRLLLRAGASRLAKLPTGIACVVPAGLDELPTLQTRHRFKSAVAPGFISRRQRLAIRAIEFRNCICQPAILTVCQSRHFPTRRPSVVVLIQKPQLFRYKKRLSFWKNPYGRSLFRPNTVLAPKKIVPRLPRRRPGMTS